MRDHRFTLMALDKDFNVIGFLDPIIIQWSRAYYHSGTFSIQLPPEQYDPRMIYVYTKDRPEFGEITQINYMSQNNEQYFYISGTFLENRLNRRVVYPKGQYTNITSDPGWVVQEGKSEDVARAYFNAFKDITFTDSDGNTQSFPLGVELIEESQHRGNRSVRHRLNDYLGNKMYSILKPYRMSPRFVYDFETSVMGLIIYRGRDITQDNQENNNPVIFSTRYGNIKNPNILISSTDMKNCYINHAVVTDEEGGADILYTYAGQEVKEGENAKFIAIDSQIDYSEYGDPTDFAQALLDEGHSTLLTTGATIKFDLDIVESQSQYYLTDFDLGDYVDIEVPEIKLTSKAVITEVNESITNGVWSASIGFNVPNVETEID